MRPFALSLLIAAARLSFAQDLVLQGGTFAFHDTTLMIHGDLIIDHATVTFTRATVGIVLEYDQQHRMSILGASTVTFDSTTVEGIGYQTDFEARAANGRSPHIEIRNGSLFTNHAGFAPLDSTVVLVDNSDVEEIHGRDQAHVVLRRSQAYLALFVPPGTVHLDSIAAGGTVTRTISIDHGWTVEIDSTDLWGVQFDLAPGAMLSASACTGVVLSLHSSGTLGAPAEASGLTAPGVRRSGHVEGFGSTFDYLDCEILLVNAYSAGSDTVRVHGMRLNEVESSDRSTLIIGSPVDTTPVLCNLLGASGASRLLFTHARVEIDSGGEPSALFTDSAQAEFEESDLGGLRMVGTNRAVIHVTRCTNFNPARVTLLDSARLIVDSSSGVRGVTVEPWSVRIAISPIPATDATGVRVRCDACGNGPIIVEAGDLLGRSFGTARVVTSPGEPFLLPTRLLRGAPGGIYFVRVVGSAATAVAAPPYQPSGR